MNLFKNLFKSLKHKEEKLLPWIPLQTIEQLNFIESKSKNKHQLIFKHSTRCGISRMVLNQFISTYNFSKDDFDLYYLDVLSYRNVSDEVSYKFQVIHESPQLLLIKNRVVEAHASHGVINKLKVKLHEFI